jgi:hypothetical protein
MIDASQVTAYFTKRRGSAEVRAVWLVHPAVAGAPARVGVLYAAGRAPTHYETYEDIEGKLAAALGADVEVVDLRRAAVAMARAVLGEGVVVYESAAGEAAAFVPG